MRVTLLVLALVLGACGTTATAPEPDERIDWPPREWRDTVVVVDPETGENLP